MHPLRKLRESGKPTAAKVGELLAKNIVFNSPILVRPIEGREVCSAIFAQSSSTRGSGTFQQRSPQGSALLRFVFHRDRFEERRYHQPPGQQYRGVAAVIGAASVPGTAC